MLLARTLAYWYQIGHPETDYPRTTPCCAKLVPRKRPRWSWSLPFGPIRVLGVVLLSSLPVWVGAGVYKGIDSSGRVVYSDRPLPESERIRLPAEAAGSAAAADTVSGANPGPYQQFEVVAPRTGETLDSADGTVQVSLLLDPPLELGHQLQVLIDGATVDGLAGRTQFILQGLAMGSHQLEAFIMDETGSPLAQTIAVSFNLREPVDE